MDCIGTDNIVRNNLSFFFALHNYLLLCQHEPRPTEPLTRFKDVFRFIVSPRRIAVLFFFFFFIVVRPKAFAISVPSAAAVCSTRVASIIAPAVAAAF